MLDIVLQGEKVQLLAERAMYWPAQKMLVVADLHWGKSAHFRKHGIAIPGNTQTQDEVKLAKLISQYSVERLVIAGDMFHSKHNKEVDVFSHWRKGHEDLYIDLVTGNHDILPQEMYEGWNLQLHTHGLKVGPFFIAHDVPEDCPDFCIHGHIHPAIRISRRGHNTIKLSCFCEDEDRFILPAFGQFTGTHVLDPAEHKHIYVIAEEAVMKWT
ncbi:ligase-associated DNA damage response endonuclease PdeM [Polluticoccus soli]|uniref:ligase-associated DNA damage response endonuclease PdeM n=1 Tax=Polluticoccus soli TaxID=3034150 RepID=UPI0023E264C5|nr:ligase-associated DNA damage response endonuclease PdeM [Flavipsychrobacter sp. JY13-12]